MSILKSELRTIIREMLDDPQKQLWSDSSLDLLTEQSQDALWSKLHDYFPYFTSQTDTLSAISPGYVDTRLVGVATGQLTGRIHKLQTVTVGSVSANALTYEAADGRDVVLQGGKVIYAPNYRYVFYGYQLWLFPLDTTPNNIEIKYSYKPIPTYRNLADSSTVPWPDGHEAVLWLRVVARAIARGGREDPGFFKVDFAEAWDEIMSSLRSPQVGPIVAYASDSPTSFGGT